MHKMNLLPTHNNCNKDMYTFRTLIEKSKKKSSLKQKKKIGPQKII